MQVRFKTIPLGASSRPVARIEGLAFDVLITSLRHFANHRRCHAVLQRRHCQRAASNDARRFAGVVVVPSRHRAEAWLAIDVADHARLRSTWATLCRAREGKLSSQVEIRATSKEDACIPES